MQQATPFLSKILVYPLKSFDPVLTSSARIIERGALQHDRQFAIVDSEDRFVNGKRNPKVHLLEVRMDMTSNMIVLIKREEKRSVGFSLYDERDEINAWLSDYFEAPVALKEHKGGGFPDDPKSPGPTIIGGSSLEEVTSWYPGIDVNEVRTRFRANLEISGVDPFWEDQLFGAPDTVVNFKIGDVHFEGTNPCQRCIVPTRHTQTAETYPDFANTFREKRQETLPSFSNKERFNHFYRFAVNTCLPESEVGKVVCVGDPLILL